MHHQYCGGHAEHSDKFFKNIKTLGLEETTEGNFVFIGGDPVGFVYDLSASGDSINDIMYCVAKQIFEKTKKETEKNCQLKIRNALGIND